MLIKTLISVHCVLLFCIYTCVKFQVSMAYALNWIVYILEVGYIKRQAKHMIHSINCGCKECFIGETTSHISEISDI